MYMQVNGSECNSIELIVPGSGHIVKGFAVLGGPILTGNITFVGSHFVKEDNYCSTHNSSMHIHSTPDLMQPVLLLCYIYYTYYICLKFVCLSVCYAVHGQHSALQD